MNDTQEKDVASADFTKIKDYWARFLNTVIQANVVELKGELTKEGFSPLQSQILYTVKSWTGAHLV